MQILIDHQVKLYFVYYISNQCIFPSKERIHFLILEILFHQSYCISISFHGNYYSFLLNMINQEIKNSF